MIPRYSRPALARIWSDAHKYETWLQVELAACEAMEAAGSVPAGTAAAVRPLVRIDADEIDRIEQGTRHDVIAFLTHVENQAGPPARFLHRGMTSSDVLDTAFALQICEALDEIEGGLRSFRRALSGRARELRAVPMVGRTHGIHAEPVTMGLVFAALHAEMGRNERRLRSAREAVAVGKLSGAVGTNAHLDPAIEARALAALGLGRDPAPTQVVPRDRHAELFCALAVTAATIEKLALTVRHWQRTEVLEAEEAFGRGQKGSSAMPHKKNPILSENLCGLSRLVRASAGAALENVALWHERDISHSSVERIIAPDTTTLVDFMLSRATGLVEGLVVHKDRLAANLERTGGLVFSEGVLLALVDAGCPRQQAYEAVQACALASFGGGGDFRALCAAHPKISPHLTAEHLARLFDVRHALRHVDAIIDRALEV